MIELIQTCSPNVYLPIAQAIIKTESNFNQFAIGVNAKGGAVKQPTSYQEAVKTAKRLIGQGLNIDMGYAQINSANLGWLGLSVEQVFNPCSNLKAMQTVYLTCYNKAGNTGLGTRMQRAFSCYNTGNFTRGFKNGYVNKITRYFNEFVVGVEQIYYQQYPSVQTNLASTQLKYSPNYAHRHSQGLPDVNPIEIQPQVTNTIDNMPKTQNTELIQPQGQILQAEPAPQSQVKQVEYHAWDIFSDYGFVR